MSNLSGRFRQTANEDRRYVLDYTLQLSAGETVLSLVTNITSPTGGLGDTPAFVVNNVVIASTGLQVVMYMSGGVTGQSYEVQVLATTSIGQVIEDVVQIDIVSKV